MVGLPAGKGWNGRSSTLGGVVRRLPFLQIPNVEGARAAQCQLGKYPSGQRFKSKVRLLPTVVEEEFLLIE